MALREIEDITHYVLQRLAPNDGQVHVLLFQHMIRLYNENYHFFESNDEHSQYINCVLGIIQGQGRQIVDIKISSLGSIPKLMTLITYK